MRLTPNFIVESHTPCRESPKKIISSLVFSFSDTKSIDKFGGGGCRGSELLIWAENKLAHSWARSHVH
jgi:hypothetical protein